VVLVPRPCRSVPDVACMFRRHLHITAFILVTAFAVQASAQDTEVKGDKPVEVVSENIATLLQDLASPTFGRRQKAASGILELGAADVTELESQMKLVPAAVATQLRILIPRLRKRLFDDRLEALTDDSVLPENPAELFAGLPEWDRYSAVAGTNGDSRAAYGELLRAERDLFAARMFGSPEFSAMLESRSAALTDLFTGDSDDEFPVASCAALMLLGSNPDVRLRGATSVNISAAFDETRFGHLVENGIHADILKAIVGLWIERPNIAVDRPLIFAIQHRLAVGRPVALKVLARPVQDQRTLYALLCLGALRDPQDLGSVERFLKAPTTVWPPREQSVRELLPGREVESSFSVQTRDVALTVALHLRGINPKDFGLNVQASERQLFTTDSMGFDNNEERDAALARYISRFPDAAVPPNP